MVKEGGKIVKNIKAVKVLGLVMAIVFCYAGIVGAQSSSATGPAAASGGAGASVDLDFQILIPSFIYFRVGSTGGTVDLVDFQPTADDVLTGATTNATSGGTVDVVLISNAGAVTIEEANDGGGNGLSDGGTNYISWGQIVTTETLSGGLTPPQLSNAGGNTSNVTTTSGNITVRSAQWTYEYNNPATPPQPGTYTGTATYTASIP